MTRGEVEVDSALVERAEQIAQQRGEDLDTVLRRLLEGYVHGDSLMSR